MYRTRRATRGFPLPKKDCESAILRLLERECRTRGGSDSGFPPRPIDGSAAKLRVGVAGVAGPRQAGVSCTCRSTWSKMVSRQPLGFWGNRIRLLGEGVWEVGVFNVDSSSTYVVIEWLVSAVVDFRFLFPSIRFEYRRHQRRRAFMWISSFYTFECQKHPIIKSACPRVLDNTYHRS